MPKTALLNSAAQPADAPVETAAAQIIRNSAYDYAAKTFPRDRLQKWAVLAINNGFPVPLAIEAAAIAVGDQLADLAFVLKGADAIAPQIALMVQQRMREQVEGKIAALRKEAAEKAAIDAKVRQ